MPYKKKRIQPDSNSNSKLNVNLKSVTTHSKIQKQPSCEILWKIYTRKNLAMDKRYSTDKFNNNYKPVHQRPADSPKLDKTLQSYQSAVEYITEKGRTENVYLIEVWRNGKRVDGCISTFFPCSCCNWQRDFQTRYTQKWAHNATHGWHTSNYVHASEFITSNVNVT